MRVSVGVLRLNSGAQGELLLEDMPAGGGGFQCVPGYHLAAADWAAAQPEDAGGAVPEMDDPTMAGYELKHVEGRAGDLLICACPLCRQTRLTSATLPRS